MVIGAFPVAKLGMLAIKQISKPIANLIKDRAKSHPVFRHYVCMPPAQFYNWMEVKTKMWALNLGRPVAVPKLNEAMAIELGANLLGEFIIFTIGAGLLIVEYVRQSNNEAKKLESQQMEKAELANNLAELHFRVERQDTQIREMTRILADLDLTKAHKAKIADIIKDENIKIKEEEQQNKRNEAKDKLDQASELENEINKLLDNLNKSK